MKALLFSMCFLILSTSFREADGLYGRWKLFKVETNTGIMTPRKIDYNLLISKDFISYNLEVNNCQSKDIVIKNGSLIIDRIACTKICCDGRIDTISNYINYSGAYSLRNDTLLIKNELSTLWLRSATQ